ncbi:hypothetical protein R1flu_011073 [Riccia fluitans]|uniref:Uncharacterized protein n=1 Tax=Riccia fluitans TaxID=41844 RepID=A0ABD1Z745_9MARC
MSVEGVSVRVKPCPPAWRTEFPIVQYCQMYCQTRLSGPLALSKSRVRLLGSGGIDFSPVLRQESNSRLAQCKWGVVLSQKSIDSRSYNALELVKTILKIRNTAGLGTVHQSSATVSLEEDDLIGNLVVVEQHASHVLSQEEPRVAVPEKTHMMVRWAVEVDVDEYPFMPSDLNEMFLKEYLLNLEKTRPDVSQILMQCMIFGGNPQGDLEDGWVIERYQRRKPSTEGTRPGFVSRTKPIFRPSMVSGMSRSDPHKFPMTQGETMVSNPDDLRMNHYWGARLTDFKPDTPAVLALLVPDNSVQPIATKLKSRTALTRKAVALSRFS